MCTIVLAAASALGSIYQGYAQQQAADAQAAAYEQNAKIAERQATDAVVRGGQEENTMRRRYRGLMARQRAATAASGIAAESGSVIDASLSSREEFERDVDINEQNAQRERWGHLVDAVNQRNAAEAARAQGRNAFTAGLIGGATSILSAAAPSIDKWWTGGVAAESGGASYSWAANESMTGLQAERAATGSYGTVAGNIFDQTPWWKMTEADKFRKKWG